MKELPDKPSELIRVALADIRKCEEENTTYRVDMDTWHSPFGAKSLGVKCSVCLAGAVMAKSLDANVDLEWRPADFDEATERRLIALDCFRNGDVVDGLLTIDGLMDRGGNTAEDDSNAVDAACEAYAAAGMTNYRNIPEYYPDTQAFRAAMLDLANELESVGR